MVDVFVIVNSFVLYLSLALLLVLMLVYFGVRMVRRTGTTRVAGNRVLPALIGLGLMLVGVTLVVLASPTVLVSSPWINFLTVGGFVVLLVASFWVAGRRL